MEPTNLSDYLKFTIKPNGNSLTEKLEQLKIRYEKVVQDSLDDTSYYRISFSKVHQTVLVMLQDSGQNLSGITDFCMNTSGEKVSIGERDAKALILLEISSISE